MNAKQRIARIKELADKATPGPWWQDANGPSKVHHGNACDRVVTCHYDYDGTRLLMNGAANAAFIAAAREDVPWLLARLAKAEELLSYYTGSRDVREFLEGDE